MNHRAPGHWIWNQSFFFVKSMHWYHGIILNELSSSAYNDEFILYLPTKTDSVLLSSNKSGDLSY